MAPSSSQEMSTSPAIHFQSSSSSWGASQESLRVQGPPAKCSGHPRGRGPFLPAITLCHNSGPPAHPVAWPTSTDPIVLGAVLALARPVSKE
ncbi:hypothetical protein GWK47_021003 [Chionoecetes opilio]|uniref:Uncharacterized protein n=1 Tax=Chionoecetes opilio TaxID=41210 RepID=A0A8J5CH28_CHIOP|nr:hypothetical protein GWK47_021003 [Chionoecetes opilio]